MGTYPQKKWQERNPKQRFYCWVPADGAKLSNSSRGKGGWKPLQRNTSEILTPAINSNRSNPIAKVPKSSTQESRRSCLRY
jgi:hypothetical protein